MIDFKFIKTADNDKITKCNLNEANKLFLINQMMCKLYGKSR